MRRLYNPFFLILIAFAAGWVFPLPVRAQSGASFTVESVHADASAENATKARETAFGQAQAIAFSTLANRLLSAEDLGRFKTPDLAAIGPMIQDFEIVNERISSVRYIGTYTFRFDPASVQRFLEDQGLAVKDTPHQDEAPSATRTLIFPFYQWGGRTLLWGEVNPWRRAWEQTSSPSILVPLGDLEDVRDMSGESALTYDRQSLDMMLARYGTNDAAIAIAQPLPDPGGKDSVGALEVQLYRAEPTGPIRLRTLVIPSVPGADLYTLAVRQVSDALREVADTGNVESGRKRAITLRLRFSGSDEWVATQRSLESFPGLGDIRILSLTPRAATLRAGFAGDGPRFMIQAQAQGFSIAPATDPDVYDLCLNAYCLQTEPSP